MRSMRYALLIPIQIRSASITLATCFFPAEHVLNHTWRPHSGKRDSSGGFDSVIGVKSLHELNEGDSNSPDVRDADSG